MQTYTWTFAQSFLVFLLIVLASQTLATRTRSIIPMPLLYGVMFTAGFELGLPRDLLLAANMVAVGTIAYNVLVVHSGTMVDLKMLIGCRRETLVALISAAVMSVLLLIVLPPLFGRELAFLSPGAVVGGGASCAIASRAVLAEHPDISFYPWMIFMFQGLFSVPVVTWAMRRETERLVQTEGPALTAASAAAPRPPQAFGLVGKIPQAYKTPAYYLALLMTVGVLNYTLQGTLLKGLGVNPSLTALILGIVVGNLGLVDRAPLFKCDSYGLLILSLMGLMANNLANTPLQALLRLVVPVLVSLAISSVILAACGWLLGRRMLGSPYAGLIITMNSIMGFPVNKMLAAQAAARAPEEMRGALTGRLSAMLGLSTMLISNGLSILLVSVLTALI